MKSSVSKRSIVIAGHKTSVSLEAEFWNSLREIARERGMTAAREEAAMQSTQPKRSYIVAEGCDYIKPATAV